MHQGEVIHVFIFVMRPRVGGGSCMLGLPAVYHHWSHASCWRRKVTPHFCCKLKHRLRSFRDTHVRPCQVCKLFDGFSGITLQRLTATWTITLSFSGTINKNIRHIQYKTCFHMNTSDILSCSINYTGYSPRYTSQEKPDHSTGYTSIWIQTLPCSCTT